MLSGWRGGRSRVVAAEPPPPPMPEQELLFPMWIVPIRTMLELAKSSISSSTGLPTHEDLQEQGALLCWKPGMNTIFFSHTWLGSSHPDPNGDKCRLIVALIEGILAGRVKVSASAMASIIMGERGFTEKELTRDYSDGYVWLDYFSIPQRHPTNQGLAIQSISGYVALSTLFVVLAGPWKHTADGSIRDVRAWGERGWCRMENLSNSLSPRQKALIVAESPTSVYSHGPRGIIGRFWTSEIVGEGTFSVDSDKAKLGPSILRLIEARKVQCDREDDVGFFRFLSAISSRLLLGTGVHLPDLPLDEWLAEMRFSGACDDEKTTGLSPLRFALVADRADLVAQLLERGADAECRTTELVPKRDRAYILPGETILNTCCTFTGSYHADCLKALLSHGVNTRVCTGHRPHATPLLTAMRMSQIHLIEPLMTADPTLWQVPQYYGQLPLEVALQTAKPHVVRHVLERYAEQLQGLPEGAPTVLDLDGQRGVFPALTAELMRRTGGAILLHRALFNIGDTRVLQMLLDAGHDPNGDLTEYLTMVDTQSDPSYQALSEKAERNSERERSPGEFWDKIANGHCPPLHLAALTGNLGAVEMLLSHGATADSQMHSRQMTPLHLAAMCGHKSCIDALLRHAPEGVNLAALRDQQGVTPAFRAARRGYVEVAAMLKRLERGDKDVCCCVC